MPTEGILTLHIGETHIGQGRIKPQPARLSIAGVGLNIGEDSGEPVTDDYPGQDAWPLVGRTVKRAHRPDWSQHAPLAAKPPLDAAGAKCHLVLSQRDRWRLV